MVHRGLPTLAGKIIRHICIALWLAAIISCLTAYLIHPDAFTPEQIAAFLVTFRGEIWLVYLGISILRGFTLLPSTPLVIAGTMLFPAQPFAVLTISVIGISLSSSMIYFFSDQLGFSSFFEKHRGDRIEKVRARLERPTGFAFVALWSFFPLVPTDLICYVAGVARMRFAKFIAALLAGELVLCSIYIFLGRTLFGYLY